MESLYFLIPIALVFVAIALRILLWALNSGQYDNLDTEAHRILFDEDVYPETKDADAESADSHVLTDNTDADKPAGSETPRKGSLDD